MVQEKTLTEEISELKKAVYDGQTFPGEKKFKIKKLSKSKMKKGYVIVQLLRENRYVDFLKLPIVKGSLLHSGRIIIGNFLYIPI
jgi:hypothetical protein